MGWRDRVKLVVKPTKRFRVWRIDVYGKPYACEGDYDTVQALNAHRWRSDWDYKIQVRRDDLRARSAAALNSDYESFCIFNTVAARFRRIKKVVISYGTSRGAS